MKQKAPEAAYILARRFNDRNRYRRRRDRQIAVELVGAEFTIDNVWFRLVGYDPRTHEIRLSSRFGRSSKLSTDEFWRLFRSGKIVKE